MFELVDRNKLLSEVGRYRDKLNSIVGIGGFTIGLACLGTKHPSVYAVNGAVIFYNLRSHVSQFFPKDITALRELAKENPDDKEIKEELEKWERLFSLKIIYENGLPFLIGYLFYCFVTFVEIFALGFKWLHWFY